MSVPLKKHRQECLCHPRQECLCPLGAIPPFLPPLSHHSTVTFTASITFRAYPLRFHRGLAGCVSPAPFVARAMSVTCPRAACRHACRHRRQENLPKSGSSLASAHVLPPS